MSNKLKVFLSGGMTGLTEEEASYWRTQFKLKNVDNELYTFIDPSYLYTPSCDSDHLYTIGTNQSYEKEAMEYDLYWVRRSDIIVVNFNSLSSIGTAQELMLAHTLNKPIIGMISEEDYSSLHPWYKEECIKIFKYKNTDASLNKTIYQIYNYLWRFSK